MSVLHALRRNSPHGVLAGIGLVLMLSSCGSDRTTPAAPETAFRSFRGAVRAVARGADGAVVWPMLGPQTQARLEARAAAAREAGIAEATAADMLDAAWAAYATDIDSVETVQTTDDGVILEVRTHHGPVWHVPAQRGASGWTFELPAPGEVPVPVLPTEQEDG